MSNISAELVKKLRELTNIGMMECKKALVEAEGDLDKAEEILRKSGQLKAAKKQDRVTAEGLIVIKSSSDLRVAALLEVNCETDFVAKDANFVEFANQAAEVALAQKIEDVATLTNAKLANGQSVEEARQGLILKIGENISLRRIAIIQSNEALGAYSHGGRIGVVVTLSGGNEQLGKDMAMQIAATKPTVVSPDQIPAELVKKERDIFSAQAATSGKPADIIAKMVEGRIKKFREENSLLGQEFVKNPDLKVADYLKQNGAQVISFTRFEVGEGIEKVVTDFAAEVMAQVASST